MRMKNDKGLLALWLTRMRTDTHIKAGITQRPQILSGVWWLCAVGEAKGPLEL